MKNKKPEVKLRAKINILGYVTQFCLNIGLGSEARFATYKRDVKVGDLVALTSCSFSKWYLSWVVAVENDRWLLESIEDGSLCWWSNVAFHAFADGEVRPEWRWTDAQYKFQDQWYRACFKKRGAYMTLPCTPIFTDDGGVTLKTRTRFGFDQDNGEKTFPNWKKVKVAEMLEFYDSVIAMRAAKPHKATSLLASVEGEK